MKLAAKGGVSWWERQSFRWFRLRKRARQLVKYAPGQPKTVLHIVGCQRSGTSMIHHLFRLDWDAVTYDEISPLSVGDKVEGLRWAPLPQIHQAIAADRAPFVACKPLVESQNLSDLLALFADSKAIWMYRDYRDVVKSNLEYFGPRTGHLDLAPILAGDGSNWRAEKLDPVVREKIRQLYSAEMTTNDAAALYWYARNSLFFSGGLAEDSRVKVCCYADLVTRPAVVMAAAYQFIGRDYPGDHIVADVVAGSHGRGQDVIVSAVVAELCDEMMLQLHSQPPL